MYPRPLPVVAMAFQLRAIFGLSVLCSRSVGVLGPSRIRFNPRDLPRDSAVHSIERGMSRDLVFPSKEGLAYTSCYCEENAYKLVQTKASEAVLRDLSVVFISSEIEKVPFWFQRDDESVCLWDYHVVVLHHPGPSRGRRPPAPIVYDFDTRLDWAMDAGRYFFCSLFMNQAYFSGKTLGKYLGLVGFRVVSAETFLKHFASDRSHMINKETGEYFRPPPKYAAIRTEEATMNLGVYRNVKKTDEVQKYGRVYSVNDFAERVLGRSLEWYARSYGDLLSFAEQTIEVEGEDGVEEVKRLSVSLK